MRKDLYQDLYNLENKHWWHISKRKIVKELIRIHTKTNDIKILDIGCGTGKNLDQFKEFGHTYGLDNSKNALRFCKKRGLTNIILGDAEKTPFGNNFFDIITILDVLEHTDDDKSIKEIHRILKKGGILIGTVPAFDRLWSRWDEILHHKRRYNIIRLKTLLNKYEFDIIKISYMYTFLVLPVFLIRLVKSFFSKKYYSSDFKLSLPFLNFILKNLMNIEYLIIKDAYLPFGLSIIFVAQKND